MNRRSNWHGGGSFRGGRGGVSFRGRGGRGNRDRNPWRGGHGFRGWNDRGGNTSFRGNRPAGGWQRRDAPSKRLSEEEIGVTEYVSQHAGFTGIIKSRYSDFQVSEIGEDGRIAKLTDLKAPEPPQDETIEEDEELLLTKYNLDILPMDVWDKINTLATCMPTVGTEQKLEIDASDMSKEQRTKIHDAVKKAFGSLIVSSTVNTEDRKFLKFEKYKKGVRVDKRVKWLWPAEYVYFIVHKENVDTMEAVVRIADKLHVGIKPSFLGYAGTKDRRAKTSQWLSVRKVDPRGIAAAAAGLRGIWVGNYEFRKENLVLGMLKGNRFRIALRNVTAPDDVVTAACEELKEKGFINYYGLQRFGTRCETPTHHVGLLLLQGNFRQAIEAILEVRSGPMQAALQAYKSEGPQAALREWPRHLHAAIELRLLRALGHNPKDLMGALGKMARNTRLLYLHSYQSLIWNRAVSERVRRFGLVPAVGDIVPLEADIKEELDDEAFVDDEDTEESTDTESQNGDLNKMADEEKMADESPPVLPPLETSSKQEKHKIPVKILTQEDIDQGKYTILDIVMPLPGNMIEYPPNMVEYYEELLVKDGLALDMKNKFKSYSLSGAYRYVITRPTDVTYETVTYNDPYADLILSDWDLLQGVSSSGATKDGKYKALLINMTLPASCYATMALRELLKRDTSCDTQALQNDYHTAAQEKPKATETKVSETEESKETHEQTSQQTETKSKESVDIKQEPEDITEENSKVSKTEKRKTETEEEAEVKKLKLEVTPE